MKRFALALALTLGVAGLAHADVWTVSGKDSPVSFVATGKPGFLKIRGEGAQLSGEAKLEGDVLDGTFKVALAPLKTGIDLRDEHMKEKYLDVAKYPTATLTIAGLKVGAGERDYDFDGKLTLKDVEKPVKGTLHLALDQASGKATGSVVFTVKVTDYPSIGVPSHLGITMAESVEVTVKLVAEKAAGVASK